MPDRAFFFGYGSLLNLATHDFPDPHPAHLTGWRRAWRATDLRPVAFLTAVQDPNHTMDGMIAHVPNADWDALDEREWAYDRIDATGSVAHPLTDPAQIAVYAVPEARHIPPSAEHPILLSYLDVVVQGFLQIYGPDGVTRFFDTTDGWDVPILNDRSKPRYPRHQHLSREERQMVDDHLSDLAAVINRPD